jgi:hypothetical protein
LLDRLRDFSIREIKRIMVDVMPMLSAPNKKKAELIDQLVNFARSPGCLFDVCKSAIKDFKKDDIHTILLQYDPKADQKWTKSAMIEHFAELNMPEVGTNLRDDGPCLAIVPYVADCGAQTADCHAQVVDYESNDRKMRKAQRTLYKKWLNGARFLRR